MNCSRCQSTQSVQIRYGNYPLCDSCYNKSELLTVESDKFSEARVAGVELRISMTSDRQELYAKFFAEEAILVKDMTDIQLKERREQLELIALEAKARISKIDWEERERKGKLSPEQREWTTGPSHDSTVTDAIDSVKKRAERKTNLEKQRERLLAVPGMDPKDVELIIQQMERKGTDKGIRNGSFKSDKPKAEIPIPEPLPAEPVKPFDPSSLFGSK